MFQNYEVDMRLNIRAIYYGTGGVLFIVAALRLFMTIYGEGVSTVHGSHKDYQSNIDHDVEKLSKTEKSSLEPTKTRDATEAMNKPETTIETKVSKQKLIVITTFMRSGSTFVGELFNLHSDVFYQFEPLHPNASVQGF